MKLLILTTYYSPDVTAASVRICQMVKRFSRDCEDAKCVRVVTFNPLYKHEIGVTEQGTFKVVRYTRKFIPAFVFMPQSLNPLTLVFWICASLKEIVKYNPDVILATTPQFAPAIASYTALKILNKPYIVDYRDDLTSVINGIAETKKFYIRYPLKVANKFVSALLSHSLKHASLVSTVNEVLQAKLLNLNKNVILVPNGIDVQELNYVRGNFDKEKVLEKNGILFSEDSRFIVYVGDLDMPYYMPEVIIGALKLLLGDGCNVKYIIIGDGKRKSPIEEMVKEMGMEDVVFLVGNKNHREVLELLLTGDVALYSLQKNDPQSGHAIGAKVYEYIGCELPILVLSDAGSAVSELVKMHGIGVVVSWNELDTLSDALRKVLGSKEYVENIRLHYPYFVEKFDRSKGMDLLCDNVKTIT